MNGAEATIVDAEKQCREQCAGPSCNQHLQKGEAADDEVFRPIEHDYRTHIPVQIKYTKYGSEVRQQQGKLWQGPGCGWDCQVVFPQRRRALARKVCKPLTAAFMMATPAAISAHSW